MQNNIGNKAQMSNIKHTDISHAEQHNTFKNYINLNKTEVSNITNKILMNTAIHIQTMQRQLQAKDQGQVSNKSTKW